MVSSYLLNLASLRFEDILSFIDSFKLYDDWIKTGRYYNDMAWKYYSIAGMIPLIILTVYRFFYSIKNVQSYMNADNFKRQPAFYIEKALTFFGLYYYIIDISLTMLDGSYTNVCRVAFMTHHIPSIPLMYALSLLNYMPWWILSVAAWHSVLIYFPDITLLNYPYLAIVFNFHYNYAFRKPFSTMKAFKFVGKSFPFIYFALVTIWYTECPNMLPFI